MMFLVVCRECIEAMRVAYSFGGSRIRPGVYLFKSADGVRKMVEELGEDDVVVFRVSLDGWTGGEKYLKDIHYTIMEMLSEHGELTINEIQYHYNGYIDKSTIRRVLRDLLLLGIVYRRRYQNYVFWGLKPKHLDTERVSEIEKSP